MLNLLRDLIGVAAFVPHGHCLLWKPGLVWLHVVSDTMITMAYYSIPITLFYFVKQRKDLPFNWIFILFAAFITACGTSHLMSVWTLWHPTYWLSGGVKAVTAIVSFYTAGALVALIPQAIALPSPAQLALANQTLQQEMVERQQAEAELIRSRDLREAIFNEATDALFLVDAQTLRTVDCNRRAVDLFQAQHKADLIGIEGHTLQRYQFSQAELAEIATEMELSEFWSRELEYVTLQGNIFWGNIAAKSITVAGQTMNLVRVTDISDRKRQEAERQRTEAQIQASLVEKEALLNEIHHRVKNNLQIVYSLLRLQRRKLKDSQAANSLLESQSRIESIALIHEKLYRSGNLAQINLAEYIPSLVTNLFSTYNVSNDRVTIKTEIADISIDVDRAIPCGLIINELVSNSLKYAFPETTAGHLYVTLYPEPGSLDLTLIVGDDGVGIPDHIDMVNLTHLDTLGLQLVHGFVSQLKGTLTTHCRHGTEFQIVFSGGML